MEVGYFHSFIDGVDFVFVDSPVFHAFASSIYGGSREVLIFLVLSCGDTKPLSCQRRVCQPDVFCSLLVNLQSTKLDSGVLSKEPCALYSETSECFSLKYFLK